MKVSTLALAIVIIVTGCTDAQRARTFNFTQAARVSCYSGNEMIFDDVSTGVIEKHDNSDGFYFVSVTTKRQTEVTGTCVVDYGFTPPTTWRATRHQ